MYLLRSILCRPSLGQAIFSKMHRIRLFASISAVLAFFPKSPAPQKKEEKCFSSDFHAKFPFKRRGGCDFLPVQKRYLINLCQIQDLMFNAILEGLLCIIHHCLDDNFHSLRKKSRSIHIFQLHHFPPMPKKKRQPQ